MTGAAAETPTTTTTTPASTTTTVAAGDSSPTPSAASTILMPPPTIALPANLAPLRDAANLLQDVLDARDDKSSPLAGLWDGPRLPATSSGTTDSSGGSTPSGGGSTPTTDAPTRYREQFQQSLLEAMAGLQTLLAGTGKNAPLAPASASGGAGGSASLLATEHCGEFLYENNFESPVGAEWSNTTTDTTPTGGRNFLGQFGNQTVSLTLTSLPAHVGLTLAFDLFVIRSWDGNGQGDAGPDAFQVDVQGVAQPLLQTSFSNIVPLPEMFAVLAV